MANLVTQSIAYDRRQDLNEWLEKFPPSKFSRAGLVVRSEKESNSDSNSEDGEPEDSSSETVEKETKASNSDMKDDETEEKCFTAETVDRGNLNTDRSCRVDGESADDDSYWESSSEEESESCDNDSDDDNIASCLKDWELFTQSGETVTFDPIRKLAVKHNIVYGIWMLFAKCGDNQIDALWRIVATQFVTDGFSSHGTLLVVPPKPETTDPSQPEILDESRVIWIYHRNFIDEDSVFQLEKSLRMVGICEPLKFKPVIHAHLNIYRDNKYGIMPSIFSSFYDENTCSYSIRRMYRIDGRGNSNNQLVPCSTNWSMKYIKYIGPYSSAMVEKQKAHMLTIRTVAKVIEEDFNSWIAKHTPSKLYNTNWLVLEQETCTEGAADFKTLEKVWQAVKESGNPVSILTISELAKRSKMMTGGWWLYVEAGYKADILWKKVTAQFAHGMLNNVVTRVHASLYAVGMLNDVVRRVQVSPLDSIKPNSEYIVIMVQHNDFTNENQVRVLNDALRSAGIKCRLFYTPDVYYHLGLFEKNEYNIRPILYSSQYDVLTRESTVTQFQADHGS